MADPTQELVGATRQLTEGVRELQSLVSRISADVGGLVRLYQPAAFRRLELAINDLNASIGRALLPVLERFRLLIRGIGDGIASLTPSGRAMIAGLVAGGVAMASLTAATIAFSLTVNSALGGLPVILGTIAGAAVGVTFALKDLGQIQTAIATVARAGTIVFNALGKAVAQVFDAVSPLIETFASLAQQTGGQLAQVFVALAPALKQVATVVAGLVTQLASIGAGNFQTLLGVFSTLMNAVSPLVQPLMTLAGTFAQLGSVVMQFSGFLLNTFFAVLTPVLTGLGAVLQVLITPINVMSGLFASIAGVVNSVMLPVFRTLGELFSGPFKALGAIWQAVFSPVVEGIQALAKEFSGLGSAFGEVGALVADIGRDLGLAFKEVFASLRGLLPDVISPLRIMANVIRFLAEQVKEFVREARQFLGLPAAEDTFGPKSQGMAVRNVQATTVREDLRQAQLAALGSGGKAEKPEVKTANTLSEIHKLLVRWFERVSRVEGVAGSALNAATNPLVSPAGWAGRQLIHAVTGKGR